MIIETMALDENTRVNIRYDEGTECPLEWLTEHELVITANPYWINPTFDTRNDTTYRILDYAPDPVEALEKHYARRGWETVTRLWRGSSQSDWLEYVLAVPQGELGDLEAFAVTFEQWLNGEVYDIEIERLTATCTCADNENCRRWETTDRIGGMYPEPGEDIETSIYRIFQEEV